MGPRALLNLPPRVLLLGLLIPTCWFLSLQLWHVLLLANMLFGVGAVFVGLLISGAVLTLSSYAPRRIWLLLWLAGEPWLLGGVPPLLGAVMPLPVLSVLVVWSLLAFWGYFGWWPVMGDDDQVGLHKARWASRREVGGLLAGAPPADGLLLGKSGGWIAVRPQPQRRELGNLLIVGPTRSGKGLLATGQLLTWRHSVVVNDIKGELFGATAGHRSQLGRVYVIDPSGIGHQYDPFASRRGEDSLYSAATSLLSSPDEADGLIFTQRATLMLTQLLLAAQRIGTPWC